MKNLLKGILVFVVAVKEKRAENKREKRLRKLEKAFDEYCRTNGIESGRF